MVMTVTLGFTLNKKVHADLMSSLLGWSLGLFESTVKAVVLSAMF